MLIVDKESISTIVSKRVPVVRLVLARGSSDRLADSVRHQLVIAAAISASFATLPIPPVILSAALLITMGNVGSKCSKSKQKEGKNVRKRNNLFPRESSLSSDVL